MLVIQDRQALILNLRDPGRVTTLVPNSGTFNYKGTDLTVLPFNIETVRYLRNIGVNAPSPIRYFYNWPGRHTPFEHQVTTSAFLVANTRAYVLNDMGTGKTLSALWAADYLMKAGYIRKCVILSPLSTLKKVWYDAIWESMSHRKCLVLHGSAERRKRLLEQDADFYVINHDGVGTILDELEARTDIDLLIIDELAVYRNRGENSTSDKGIRILNRYGAVEDLIRTWERRKTPLWVWGMTGSPIPHAPTDAWAQCRLVTPETVPRFFGQFRDKVMYKISMYKWVNKPNAKDEVFKVMQPSIRFARNECIDLPETMYKTVDCELTADQKKHYNKIKDEFFTQTDAGSVLAANSGVKFSKLLQAACGILYTTSGEVQILDASIRLAVVQEFLEQAQAKVIIYVPFEAALGLVAEFVRKLGYTAETVNGQTPKGKRDQIFTAFQTREDPHVIVADPRCMAHGLSLIAADTILWYAPLPSNEIYEQACARIPRPGQKLKTMIGHIAATEVERKIYHSLAAKHDLQGSLLDLISADE